MLHIKRGADVIALIFESDRNGIFFHDDGQETELVGTQAEQAAQVAELLAK